MTVDLRHMRPQIAEAENFLRLMFNHGDLVEIRGLRKGGPVMRALCDDPRKAAVAAAAFSNEGVNVYYVINPIDPECEYARRCAHKSNINKPFRSVRVTATDREILRRNIYFFDADPERGVKDTCSTDAEKASALDVATKLVSHLGSLGFPEPVWVDSGSGYHLLYKADGPVNDRRLKAAMKLLSDKFSTPAAKIDRVVVNDARIARLPGFRNIKGSGTPDRPHRLAKVMSVPTTLKITSSDLLQTILGDDYIAEAPRKPRSQSRSKRATIDVTDETQPHRSRPTSRKLLLDKDGVLQLAKEFPEILSIYEITDYGDALYFALSPCPFKGSEHTDQQVGMGKSCIILSPEYIGFNCFSDDCGHHTFAALLRLLHQKTGRRFSRRVWSEPDDEYIAKRWGHNLEDVERTDSLVEEQPKRATVEDIFASIVPYLVDQAVELDARFDTAKELANHRELVDRILRTRNVDQALNYLAFANPSGNTRQLVVDRAAEESVETTGYISQLMSIPEDALTQLRKNPERHVSKGEFKFRLKCELPFAV